MVFITLSLHDGVRLWSIYISVTLGMSGNLHKIFFVHLTLFVHSAKNCFLFSNLSENSANNMYAEVEPELASLEGTDDDKCDSDTKAFFDPQIL